MRHDDIVVVGALVLVEQVQEQGFVTVVNVQVGVAIGPDSVDKGVVGRHFVGAQFVEQEQDVHLGNQFGPGDVIAFSLDGGNHFAVLQDVVGLFHGIPGHVKFLAQDVYRGYFLVYFQVAVGDIENDGIHDLLVFWHSRIIVNGDEFHYAHG
jgi:hypothetical protein